MKRMHDISRRVYVIEGVPRIHLPRSCTFSAMGHRHFKWSSTDPPCRTKSLLCGSFCGGCFFFFFASGTQHVFLRFYDLFYMWSAMAGSVISNFMWKSDRHQLYKNTLYLWGAGREKKNISRETYWVRSYQDFTVYHNAYEQCPQQQPLPFSAIIFHCHISRVS